MNIRVIIVGIIATIILIALGGSCIFFGVKFLNKMIIGPILAAIGFPLLVAGVLWGIVIGLIIEIPKFLPPNKNN